MKLEPNMYIRTKDGIIAKVDYIDDDTIFFDKELYKTYGDSINFLEKDNLEKIAKVSYNIIDLIEVGDILEVFSDLHDLLGNEVLRIKDEKHLQHLKNGFDKGYFHLITVLTKEQFKQMSYKWEEMK